VNVLGAVRTASGWDEVSQLFRWLGSGFSDCTSYPLRARRRGRQRGPGLHLGYEHTAASWDGTPLDPYTLRVTNAYRRQHSEWKISHRHADSPPINQTFPADAGVSVTGDNQDVVGRAIRHTTTAVSWSASVNGE
jgi:hypothetical protein